MNSKLEFGKIDYKDRGANILEGILPKGTRNDSQKEMTVRKGNPKIDYNYLNLITTEVKREYDTHIDIDAADFTLEYSLPYEQKVDYFYVNFYAGKDGDFGPKKFEVYASRDRESLFSEKSLIASIDISDSTVKENITLPYVAVKILTDIKCKFIALRQIGTFDTEPVSRVANFFACNFDYDIAKNYINSNYSGPLLLSIKDAKGIVSGDKNMLCDGIVMYDPDGVKMENGEVTVALKYKKVISKILIFAKKAHNIEVALNGDYKSLTCKEENAEFGRKIYTITLNESEPSDEFKLRFLNEAEIDQILAFSNKIEVVVDTDKIINDDYLGLGANVIPTHLFEGSRCEGFNEGYYELEKRRIAAVRPSIVRLWFQLDWFIMDEDGYINRKYCFNSAKMTNLYKELDAYKAAGVEIALNYGWKIGFEAQKWFSFPDVFIRRASAPKDLEHFATSCSDCLRELIINRGYDNIKYLTFFNEPNGGIPNGWDFLCPKGYDIKAYWAKMITLVDAQLKKDGLRNKVKLWAAEAAGTPENFINDAVGEWIDYLNKNCPDTYEYSTFHQYKATYQEGYKNAVMAREKAGKHPCCLTEFSAYETFESIENGYDFNRNNICDVLGYTNGGISLMLFWVLSGVYIDEAFFHNGSKCAFWSSPVVDREPHVEDTTIAFYQMSLITNYIPRHSKVLGAAVLDDLAHAIAIETEDGEHTVAIESDNLDEDKEITFNFGKNINKKFYKHIFTLDCKPDANMIIPTCVGELEVKDILTDTVGKEYSFVLYTTIKPREQVVLDKVYVCLKPGEQVKLNAKTIDGNGKIKWSLCDTFSTTGYKGTITEDGLYTASDEYYKNMSMYGMGAVFAAKAESESGEYGICVIEVKI